MAPVACRAQEGGVVESVSAAGARVCLDRRRKGWERMWLSSVIWGFHAGWGGVQGEACKGVSRRPSMEPGPAGPRCPRVSEGQALLPAVHFAPHSLGQCRVSTSKHGRGASGKFRQRGGTTSRSVPRGALWKASSFSSASQIPEHIFAPWAISSCPQHLAFNPRTFLRGPRTFLRGPGHSSRPPHIAFSAPEHCILGPRTFASRPPHIAFSAPRACFTGWSLPRMSPCTDVQFMRPHGIASRDGACRT